MSTTAIIIQARLGSRRLPCKTLLPLPTGRTVVYEVAHRCSILGTPHLVVATPLNDVAMISHAVGRETRVIGVGGDEDDVLARYDYVAGALEPEPDVIVRITADCPMLNWMVVADTLDLYRRTEGCDYASNCWPARHFPQGWDCEVFSRAILKAAATCATEPYDREHVSPWIRRNAKRWALLKAMDDRSHERVTLDTLEDYRHIWREMSK